MIAMLPKLAPGWGSEALWRWVYVPAVGALRYGPSALLAVAAAFASAQFAQHYTIFPGWLAWLIGISFEWLYLGSLAMSAALRQSRYFRPVNLGGMAVSIIYGTLYAADKYGALQGVLAWGDWVLWLFAFIHAAPLAGMNFLYNSLIHEYHVEQRIEADQEAKRIKAIATCPYCGEERPSQLSVYSHYRTCPQHPKNIKER